MPILKRLYHEEPEENGKLDPRIETVADRAGRRITMEAIREKVRAQFIAETAGRPDIWAERDTLEKQIALIMEVIHYVTAAEGAALFSEEVRALAEDMHADFFGFGPLDPFFEDETVTEIVVDGPDTVSVRHGGGELEMVGKAFRFRDREHLATVLDRVFAANAITFTPETFFVEAGIFFKGRPARLSLILPAASPEFQIHMELRLHPPEPLPLDALMSGDAAAMLREIIAGGHGLLIVGDSGAGKTTLLNALALLLSGKLAALQRADEMTLPEEVERLTAEPTDPDSFERLLDAARDVDAEWLLVDELRSDEGAAWELLREPVARYVWAFRGSARPERFLSAFSIMIRRYVQDVPQADIDRALAGALPFVAVLTARGGDLPRLAALYEMPIEEENFPHLVPLFRLENGDLIRTHQDSLRLS